MPARRIGQLFDRLGRDLSYGMRRLTRTPGFTFTAILSLAIGIGGGTAMFSVVNAIVFRRPPVAASEQLLAVFQSDPESDWDMFSYPDYRDLRDRTSDVFSGVASTRPSMTELDVGDTREIIIGEAVSGNFFSLLGVQAQLGRTLLPSDDVSPGAHPVVMLSHHFWQSRFGGDPAVVGSEVRLGRRPYTIVGVAPREYPGSFFFIGSAFFVPIMMINQIQPFETDELEDRGNHGTVVIARLRPGVEMPQAQTAVDRVADDLNALGLENRDPDGVFRLVPRDELIFFPPLDALIRAASWLMMVVVSLVMVMVVNNLASFLMARAIDRRKEIAVRLALGARRVAIMRQLMIEAMLLGSLGGGVGVGLAALLLQLLGRLDVGLMVPVDLDLRLDGLVVVYSVAVSVGAGLLLGVFPALQNRAMDVAATIRAEDAGGGGGGKSRLRNWLVIAQVAISLFLLLGAGLFVRSLAHLEAVDAGFGEAPAALLDIFIVADRYQTRPEGRQLVQRLAERFQQLPGVEVVGFTSSLHLNPMNIQVWAVNVDGVEPPPGREFYAVDRATVDAGFFPATGIRIVEGRVFDERDGTDSEPVVIVSEAMARRFWPGRSAVGGMVTTGDGAARYRVIGVASDAKVRFLSEAPRPFLYVPLSQDYSSNLTVVARTRMPAGQTALDLAAAAAEVDPDLPVLHPRTMADHLRTVLLPARLSAAVLAAFAVVALTLVVIGLYGVVGYAAAKRRREVGIRISLGATGADVIRLLMATGLRLVVIGIVIGLAVTVLSSRLVGGLLFEVSPLDPVTFAAVVAVLVGVTAGATLVPARRASRTDPAGILRSE